MKRLVCLVLLACSMPVLARGNSRAEAQQVVDQLATGSIGLDQAVNRLAFLGEGAWAANELTLLLHRAPDTRRRGQLLTAIAALAVPGDDDVVKALLSGLSTDDVALRVAVLRGLGRAKHEHSLMPLVLQLKDALPTVRREAARALGELALPKAAPALAAAVKTEEDVEARAAMLVALGRVGDRKQGVVLEPFLKDTSETTRLSAAQGLCLLGDKKGFDFAKSLLGAQTSEARMNGVRLFEGLSAKVAGAALLPALADTDAHVRALAGRVLYQGGDKSKLAWLVVQSDQAQGEAKFIWEEQIEKLHLTDEDRAALLKHAGAK